LKTERLTRRSLITHALSAGTALALYPTLLSAREYRGGDAPLWSPNVADEPYYGTEYGHFFTPAERRAADALTARIIPTDESGPGAREADVVIFIDRQLAGFYGRGQRWYMRGPFPDPLETQGYQSEHTPAGLWRHGLAALDAHCRETHDGRDFVDLSEQEQDAVLKAMDEEEIEFETVSAKQFFDFAKEMTIEGFFCDPVYGGNRDMAGWRYVGFPGARYDYRDFIHHNGAAVELPPVGLLGAPYWTR
jgi:gluconate 2-dehydrogenase gamma chain